MNILQRNLGGTTELPITDNTAIGSDLRKYDNYNCALGNTTSKLESETIMQYIQQDDINHYAVLNKIGHRFAMRRLMEN